MRCRELRWLCMKHVVAAWIGGWDEYARFTFGRSVDAISQRVALPREHPLGAFLQVQHQRCFFLFGPWPFSSCLLTLILQPQAATYLSTATCATVENAFNLRPRAQEGDAEPRIIHCVCSYRFAYLSLTRSLCLMREMLFLNVYNCSSFLA